MEDLQVDTEELIAGWLHDDAEFAFRPTEDEAAQGARDLLRLLADRLTPEGLAELRRGYGLA